MIISNWLREAITKLQPENGTARLDAEVLLASELGVDRSWLHAHPDTLIDQKNIESLQKKLQRRITHEPLAYILGSIDFYGRTFHISNGVLIPRPESETMIDIYKTLQLNHEEKNLLIDVGTGSGALAITSLLESNIKKAVALDIDETCLKIAKTNATRHNVKIDIQKSDLLNYVSSIDTNESNLFILANLPYVPNKYSINIEARNEPPHAIFGGEDGLDLYRKMFEQLNHVVAKSYSVLTESLPFQHKDLALIAEQYGYKLIKSVDFIQLFQKNTIG